MTPNRPEQFLRLAVLLGLIAACAPILAQNQVYKCTVNGAVVYQQEKCNLPGTTSSRPIAISPRADDPSSPSSQSRHEDFQKRIREIVEKSREESAAASEDIRRKAADVKIKQAEYDRLINSHCAGKTPREPEVGMMLPDVQCNPNYRNASAINTTQNGRSTLTQYVYRSAGRTTYLYFTDGKLASIQTSVQQ